VCQNRPVRQDYLDELVWREVLRLVQDPVLLQGEIDRRIREAKKADPVRQREQYLNREQVRAQNKIDRLLTAYQEELITLEQLRQRMPELRKQEKAVRCELESLQMAATDQARYLRVVDSLSKFRARLQGNAERLDLVERRKIIRLLVREILIDRDAITIRHSIPPTNSTTTPTAPSSPSASAGRASDQCYRLCTRGNQPFAQ
jgi:site-specific DNA recombinase